MDRNLLKLLDLAYVTLSLPMGVAKRFDKSSSIDYRKHTIYNVLGVDTNITKQITQTCCQYLYYMLTAVVMMLPTCVVLQIKALRSIILGTPCTLYTGTFDTIYMNIKRKQQHRQTLCFLANERVSGFSRIYLFMCIVQPLIHFIFQTKCRFSGVVMGTISEIQIF